MNRALSEQVLAAVRTGESCSEGHEASPMALCCDSGYQNGLEQFYWFCPICTKGSFLVERKKPLRRGAG